MQAQMQAQFQAILSALGRGGADHASFHFPPHPPDDDCGGFGTGGIEAAT